MARAESQGQDQRGLGLLTPASWSNAVPVVGVDSAC